MGIEKGDFGKLSNHTMSCENPTYLSEPLWTRKCLCLLGAGFTTLVGTAACLDITTQSHAHAHTHAEKREREGGRGIS